MNAVCSQPLKNSTFMNEVCHMFFVFDDLSVRQYPSLVLILLIQDLTSTNQHPAIQL